MKYSCNHVTSEFEKAIEKSTGNSNEEKNKRILEPQQASNKRRATIQNTKH